MPPFDERIFELRMWGSWWMLSTFTVLLCPGSKMVEQTTERHHGSYCQKLKTRLFTEALLISPSRFWLSLINCRNYRDSQAGQKAKGKEASSPSFSFLPFFNVACILCCFELISNLPLMKETTWFASWSLEFPSWKNWVIPSVNIQS